MHDYREIETMLEIVELAISRQEAEIDFFRRSAEASSSEAAKSLFVELAEELTVFCEGLEERRKNLLNTLNDLQGAMG